MVGKILRRGSYHLFVLCCKLPPRLARRHIIIQEPEVSQMVTGLSECLCFHVLSKCTEEKKRIMEEKGGNKKKSALLVHIPYIILPSLVTGKLEKAH